MKKEYPKWHATVDKLPSKSGSYLTCICHGEDPEFNSYFIHEFSKKHQAFNASDDLPSAENALKVDAWMELPKPYEQAL